MVRCVGLTAALALALASCGGGGTQATPPGPTPTPTPSPSPPPPLTGLTFSTLLDGASGSGYEETRGVALDAQGNIYLVGGTTASDFPTTAGAYDRSFGGGGSAVGLQGASDAFVVKMAPDGHIIWSTFLGGPNYERAYAVRVGTDGSVYVGGRAGPGFPTTAGVVQPNFAGDSTPNAQYGQQDGFVAKLSADGSRLIWSTYVGDAGDAFLRDIDIDAQGRAYLAVVNVSLPITSFITANAWQKTIQDGRDAAYVRLSADATHAEYGTYFGGSPGYQGQSTGVASIRVDPNGGVAVASVDKGLSIATTPGSYQSRNAGGADMVVMKFSSNDQIGFVSYLGGSQNEDIETHVLAIDNVGRIYVTGSTQSVNFPVTANVLQPQFGGRSDTFVSILSADGSRLLASSLFGGSGDEMVQGINVLHRNGSADAVVISGETSSSNLSATAGVPQARLGGGLDGFVAVLSSDLSSLRYFTFLGGSAEDSARDSAISPDGLNIFVGGYTLSGGFPTTSGALDSHLDGTYAAWAAGFRLN
ncbi:SBBP repeat-containing protein [Aquisediminimonas profunda]|uniref:SBBP repeat-containing protein n=1 Tax=Aquisediminimonas profunda TaxID=1550733 RepID=UPI001C6327D0|nr:SBBP repeat-containing protein [Aquisediminimonas profunda]